jgi:hypothetical protein
MNTKKVMSGAVLSAALFLGGMLYGQKTNINPHLHPNLAAAQKLCEQAFSRVGDAQRANEFDLEGHAQKARDLLEQASAELKMAAQASNEHK